MEKILGVIGDWLGENWGWIVLAGVFVDISPIKFSPITGMLKWIGRKLTGEIREQIGGAMGLRREDAADGSDETFRGYIRAKLALWRWDGSNENVGNVLGEGLPGKSILIRDRGDLTVEVSGGIGGLPGRAGNVLPVPAGVKKVMKH